ncbi:alpha/beta fold hydrolase [Chelatococcus reniformis]|nr:alpha/beta hydrolase [Chelatococcus reniformis]
MEHQQPRAPLAERDSGGPPAPDWFTAALARAPERILVPVADARIETLIWGERGRPGLLFLHGNGAHADWWSFIAPFFADDYRVAAMSWSGMGGSDRRPHYTLDLFVQEILEVAQAAGLFDQGLPTVVGHSFGGTPLIACAARHGERLKAAVVVDTPIMSPQVRRERRARRGEPREPRAHQIYPTLEAALARFRFQPPQPCEHPYIADHIGRTSLRQQPCGGYSWRFDPFMWKDYRRGNPTIDLPGVRCPVALMYGEKSSFLDDGIVDYTRSIAPPGTPIMMIAEAHHHIMVDQPLAFVSSLRTLLAAWPGPGGLIRPGA